MSTKSSDNGLRTIIMIGFTAHLLETWGIIPIGVGIYVVPFSALSLLTFFIFSERTDEESEG